MTDLIQYLIVVLVLYLCECFQRTGPAAWVFLGERRISPIHYPGNGSWGWVFANPFRPFQAPIAIDPPKVIETPEGILPNPRYSSAPLELMPWPAVAKVPNPPGARSSGDRMSIALAAMFDDREIANRVHAYQAHCVRLRRAAAALGATIFVLWPALTLSLGFTASLGIIVVVAYFLAGYGTWRFRQAHAELFPGLLRERLSESLKFALYPFTLFRAADHLAANLFVGIDRSLAVKYLTPKRMRSAWYRELLREAGHPPTARLGQKETQAAEKFYAKWFDLIRQVAETDGVNVDNNPPKNAAAWCPVCLTEFQSAGNPCEDCGGVPLAVRTALARKSK